MPPVDLPVASVVIACVTAVSAALAAMVKLFLNHISRERQEDRLTWSNHLSQSIAVQQETARNLGVLATGIAVMTEGNEKNMQWARDAMSALVREIGRRPGTGD